MSVALHRRYNHHNIKLNILGVDIDVALIKRANDSLINNDTTGKQSDIAGDNAEDTKQDVTKGEISDNETVKANTTGEISDKETVKANTKGEMSDKETVKANTTGEISDKETEKAASSGGIKFVHADVMSDEGIAQIQDYLKSQDVQKFDMIFLFR